MNSITNSKQLRERESGKFVRTGVTNEIVRALNGLQPAIGMGQVENAPWPKQTFVAEIVTESVAHPGRYSWKMKLWQNGSLVDTNPLVFDKRHTLREINGYSGLAAGQWVHAEFVGIDPSAGDSADSSSNSLSSISSSAGSLTTEPVYTFTYTLPAGGARYQVLQKIDDKGTVGWDWTRVHDGTAGPPVPPDSSSSSTSGG